MKSVFIITALTFSSSALASISAPLWECRLDGTDLSGYTGALGLSFSDVKGEGMVRCRSLIGQGEMNTPVKVALLGLGAGLGFAHIEHLNVAVAAVGVSTPNDLYGTFKLQAEAAFTLFTGGAAADTYAAINDAGVSVGIGFSDYRGSGLDVNAELQGISITPYTDLALAPAPQEK